MRGMKVGYDEKARMERYLNNLLRSKPKYRLCSQTWPLDCAREVAHVAGQWLQMHLGRVKVGAVIKGTLNSYTS
jgi:hypothetical protein